MEEIDETRNGRDTKWTRHEMEEMDQTRDEGYMKWRKWTRHEMKAVLSVVCKPYTVVYGLHTAVSAHTCLRPVCDSCSTNMIVSTVTHYLFTSKLPIQDLH